MQAINKLDIPKISSIILEMTEYLKVMSESNITGVDRYTKIMYFRVLVKELPHSDCPDLENILFVIDTLTLAAEYRYQKDCVQRLGMCQGLMMGVKACWEYANVKSFDTSPAVKHVDDTWKKRNPTMRARKEQTATMLKDIAELLNKARTKADVKQVYVSVEYAHTCIFNPEKFIQA